MEKLREAQALAIPTIAELPPAPEKVEPATWRRVLNAVREAVVEALKRAATVSIEEVIRRAVATALAAA
ncbi:MAG: hypothetical protein Q7R81_07685 [Candidatus Peregrinibacteria bacterium]|nr:hypothetical protein [Candidatus Peregrinibacteria bacterium]